MEKYTSRALFWPTEESLNQSDGDSLTRKPIDGTVTASDLFAVQVFAEAPDEAMTYDVSLPLEKIYQQKLTTNLQFLGWWSISFVVPWGSRQPPWLLPSPLSLTLVQGYFFCSKTLGAFASRRRRL